MYSSPTPGGRASTSGITADGVAASAAVHTLVPGVSVVLPAGAYRPTALARSGESTPTTAQQEHMLQPPLSPGSTGNADEPRVSPYKPLLTGPVTHATAPNNAVSEASAFPHTPSSTPTQKYNPVCIPPRNPTPSSEVCGLHPPAAGLTLATALPTEARVAAYNPLQPPRTEESGSAQNGPNGPKADDAAQGQGAAAPHLHAPLYNPFLFKSASAPRAQNPPPPQPVALAASKSARAGPATHVPAPVAITRPPLPVLAALSAAATTSIGAAVVTAAAGTVLAALPVLAAAGAQEPSERPAVQSLCPAMPTQLPGEAEGDEERQMQQAELLHELVDGKFDVATCRDVLAQLGGDIDRAAHFILDGHDGNDGRNENDGQAGAAATAAEAFQAPGFGAQMMDAYTAQGDLAAARGFGSNASGSGTAAGVAASLHGDTGHTDDPAHESYATYGTWDLQQGTGFAGNGGGVRAVDASLSGSGGGGTWEDCAAVDPWSCLDASTAVTSTAEPSSSGMFASGAGTVEADGFFGAEPAARATQAADAAAAAVAAVAAGQPSRRGSGASTPRGSRLQDFGDVEDGWALTDGELEEGCEDPLEELRIYFPHLEERVLRETLEMLDGNVQESLQLLSELHEEEIYRSIERRRQAESDAALARQLSEQHCLSPSGPSAAFASDSAAEDYVMNAAEGISEQMSLIVLREQQRAGGGRSDDARSGRERWGLRLLVRVFGPEVDEELLTEVLATHNGDVEAARAALRAMGLTEQRPPPPPTPAPAPRQLSPPKRTTTATSTAAAAAGGLAAGLDADAWFNAADVWPEQDGGSPFSDTPLHSRRAAAPPQRAAAGEVAVAGGSGSSRGGSFSSGAGGGLAAALAAAHGAAGAASGGGGGGAAGSSMRRRSGTGTGTGAYPLALAPVLSGAELASNAAVLGPPRVYPARATTVTASAAAAVTRAATSPEAAAGGASTSGGGGGQGVMGPIRLLATIGLDFHEMGLSQEALECIRVAFNESPLSALFQQSGANSVQELLELRRVAAGRPGGGMTHEEKQSVWAIHREMPLGLKAMKELLRRGAKAAYDSDKPGCKRLARELKDACVALEGAIREQHQQASDRIYAGINAALQQQWKTDLHALLPHEAMQKLDEQLGKLRILGGNVDWLIITGKGLHSRGDGPKLPAMVDEWLARRGLHGLQQPGAVMVRLNPHIFDRLGQQAGGGGAAAAAVPA